MNIALIGMMGAGKSTIGELLANYLSYTFVDTDEEIVKQEQISINEIFSNKGENYFREVEATILKKILNADKQVVSTGGGIIKKEENISILKEKSITIYLKASSKALYERVKNNKDRPLLNSGDMLNKIETLLEERKDKYSSSAKIIIETENKTPDEIVKEIIGKL